uniref:Uncharacterized protein n=1 Tax=Siphoviridae sp. ctu9a31 TaxID=2825712 RepID=A0A8S5Q8Z2_9CAUD|nr:MAG TPA: hypothetical protein [Siphoviridae sp. ctu9a31]
MLFSCKIKNKTHSIDKNYRRRCKVFSYRT